VYILDEIRSALGELGADLTDVVRTRVYLTSIDDWPEVGRAHGEASATPRRPARSSRSAG